MLRAPPGLGLIYQRIPPFPVKPGTSLNRETYSQQRAAFETGIALNLSGETHAHYGY